MNQITEEDFRYYPTEVTSYAIFESEYGDLFGGGHIDKKEFLDTLQRIYVYNEFKDNEYSGFTEDDILHLYAKTKHKTVDGEFVFTFCEKDEEGSFPITALDS